MDILKKLLNKKNLRYKGEAGSGTVFVVIVVLMMVAVAFTFIGGKMPQMDNSKIGSQVVLVTSAPQDGKQNLQLYTFIGLSITPSPTPTPDPNPIPLPQITNALSPACQPGGPVNGPSIITVNPDKTVSINGKKTFLVFTWTPTVSQAGAKNDGFSEIVQRYDFGANSWGSYWGGDYRWRFFQSQYQANNLFYTVPSAVCSPLPSNTSTCYPTPNNPIIPFTALDRDAPKFFGYVQLDEPADSKRYGDYNSLKVIYDAIKSFDQNHLVIVDHYTGDKTLNYLLASQDYGDVLSEDHYVIRNDANHPDPVVTRNMYLYYYEYFSNKRVFSNGSSVDTFRKPFYAIIQTAGKDVPDSNGSIIMANTPDEVRLQSFDAITIGYQGIGHWPYNGYCPACTPPNMGAWTNPALWAGIKDLYDEIKSLNGVLILSDVGRSWLGHENDTVVTITHPNMMTTVSGGYGTQRKISYVLKKDTVTNTYYLITVNKDPAQLQNVSIKINGMSGAVNALTVGARTTGTGAKGRTIPLVNGQFSDTFDGHAVHIYQIYSGPTPPPLPSCN